MKYVYIRNEYMKYVYIRNEYMKYVYIRYEYMKYVYIRYEYIYLYCLHDRQMISLYLVRLSIQFASYIITIKCMHVGEICMQYLGARRFHLNGIYYSYYTAVLRTEFLICSCFPDRMIFIANDC